MNTLLTRLRFAVVFLMGASWIMPIHAEDTWPREIDTPNGTIVIYQPQLERFSGDHLEARAAMAVTPKKTKTPVFGAAWFNCRVSTDRDTRMVILKEIEVESIRFPEVEQSDLDQLTGILESEIPKWTITFSLDRILADLAMDENNGIAGDQYNNQPPEIIFETIPSVLVIIDGEPIFEEIEGLSDYLYIVNTPFFIAAHRSRDRFYLYGDKNWYQATALEGSWQRTLQPPRELNELMARVEAEKEKNEAAPAEDDPVATASKVYVRTRPAELIQSRGEPQYRAVEGTDLLYMSNSENDIIMDIQSQTYYVLIAGRWYRSTSLTENQWVFVPGDQLPDDFAMIPESEDISTVRSAVPGTMEAREAILDNSIPQTAEVDRNEATVEVTYDGDPQFENIGGTEVAYAINTNKQVLLIDNQYYCVDDAIWFVASDPYGPWSVCVDVPTQVQSIPPESPVYNVRYVYVYNYTPDIVYVGYTPGYFGSYVYHGCVIYGTGYYYRPWYRTYYYPRPVTYGFGVHYNPYTGWGFSFGVSTGWFYYGYGMSSRYYYGGYWGPRGYHYGYRHGYGHGYHRGYNAGFRAGYYYGNQKARPTTYSNNMYARRDDGIRATGANPRRTPSNARNTITSNDQVRKSRDAVPRTNNVYTDKDGNVHRRTEHGWQKRENGSWRDVPGTTPETNQRDIPRGERPSNVQSRDQNINRQAQGQARSKNRPPTTQQGQNQATRPDTPVQKPSSPGSLNQLNRSQQSRDRGSQRVQNYNRSVQNPPPSRSTRSKSSGAGPTRRR
jgi:hypothetical protein